MSRRPNKDDISIGEDRWITFGELNHDQELIELDPILMGVMPFLDQLETECVAGCCGSNAYRFWPEDIKRAMSVLNPEDRERLDSNLDQIQREIEGLQTDTVVSHRMNQLFRKTVFLQLIAHIRSVAG